MQTQVRAILFDADGVLVDTCELHYLSLNRALALHGFCIEREEHVLSYNGLPTRKKLDLLSQHKGLDRALHDQILVQKQRLTLESIKQTLSIDLQKAHMMRALRDAGFKTAVCSNAVVESVGAMLDAIGVLPFVDAYFGNDQGFASKPAPDLYLAAAKTLGVTISECAIVEDSPVGIAAAIATGCPNIHRVESPQDVTLNLFESYIEGVALVRSA